MAGELNSVQESIKLALDAADAATDVTSEYSQVKREHKKLESKVSQIHRYTTITFASAILAAVIAHINPAAPAPIATKAILIIASKVFVFEFEVKKPTAHVNITRDITLGFIKRYKDLINSLKSSETVFFLIILNKRLSDMIDLFYIY